MLPCPNDPHLIVADCSRVGEVHDADQLALGLQNGVRDRDEHTGAVQSHTGLHSHPLHEHQMQTACLFVLHTYNSPHHYRQCSV